MIDHGLLLDITGCFMGCVHRIFGIFAMTTVVIVMEVHGSVVLPRIPLVMWLGNSLQDIHKRFFINHCGP